MDKLLAYINSLSASDQLLFAQQCQTTVGYLRKAVSINQQISEGLCLRIVAASKGALELEDMRPDVNWAVLRNALMHAPEQVEQRKQAA